MNSRERLFTAVGVGLSFILTVANLIGLFQFGLEIAVTIVVIGILIVVGAIWIELRSQTLPPALQRSGFAYPEAHWLRDQTSLDDKIIELVKGSLLLLIMDRTPSGFWGKTYLYRRALSNSGLPLSYGSLTGTPLSLIAIASCLQIDEKVFRAWAYPSLSQTLAKIITDEGNYIMGYRIGTVGENVPVFEPMRHAAGGLLSTLLFADPGPRDLGTIELLITTPTGKMGWDKAVVFRALLHASYLPSISRDLRRRANKRYKQILQELTETGESSVSGNQIWADPYNYGTNIKNQWMTMWAILPALHCLEIPRNLRSNLEKLLRRFLLSQYETIPTGAIIPNSVEKTGKGSKGHIFGTAISILTWRTLALYGLHKNDEDDYYAKDMLNRLVGVDENIVAIPSEHQDGLPSTLEGYFAWAGLCLVASSLGIQLPAHEFRKILTLADFLHADYSPQFSTQQLNTQYEKRIGEAGLFPPAAIWSIAASAGRISKYYDKVMHYAPQSQPFIGGVA